MEIPNLEQLLAFYNTPPLWHGEFSEVQQFEFPAIPSRSLITEVPSPKTRVLGKRMEHFCEFLLRNSETYEVLLANKQISRNKITLGEIDYLLKNRQTGEIIHLELVYKFYVYDTAFSSEVDRWIGPNRKDTLVKKLQKLKTQQFPLLEEPESIELLESLKIDKARIKQLSCFKAWLFPPKKATPTNLPIINSDCISGYWISYNEFSEEEYAGNRFYLPPKPQWPLKPNTGENWMNFEETRLKIEQFHEKEKSPLVWMKTRDRGYERFFVVWWPYKKL
ncbi:DUF1853 family protein [Salegentibacter sp. HM20]